MRFIALPENIQHCLVWYLAMEEFVAANLDSLVPSSETGEREGFFIWQVPPTVIFGRNQVMEAEVNVAYCRSHGVRFFRRKSGGGCVYADMGNVMLSYVCDGTDVAFTFSRFIGRVALALRQLGVDATASGRNDVLVGGRKVSGNAFTLLPKGSIVHGTMMYDVDFEALVSAITPSQGKISSKGVSSVRSHVTNLKEELEAVGKLISLDAFKKHLIDFFCKKPDGTRDETVLTQEDMAAIDEIEKTYLDPAFLEGRHHDCNVEFSGRIKGSGEIKINIGLKDNRIDSLHMEGDFFQTKENAIESIESMLKGAILEKDTITNILKDKDLGIMGLSPEGLLELMFPSKAKDN